MADDSANAVADEEQIQRIVKEFEAKLRANLKKGIRPLHEIEDEVDVIVESVKRTIIKEATEELGSCYVGTRTLCYCGGRAKYAYQATRQLISRHGEFRIVRAYYYCRSCRKGFCPLDAGLDIGSGECSRSVQALAARFCSHMSFELAARELEVVCGIRLSATTMQNYSKAIGTRIAEEWNANVELAMKRRLQPSGLRIDRLYASMDGVMIHVGGEWRETKLGAVYQRSPSGRACHTQYYASLEQSHIFGRKMRVLAHMAGSDSCHDLTVIGDGAPWIWQETGKHFSQSRQVLDFYHGVEHIAVAATARFASDKTAAKIWLNQQIDRLKASGPSLVIADVEGWKPRKKDNKEIKRKLISYLCENKARMQYPKLIAEGYYIGSGIIEAGAKTVVKARMGASGMRWEQAGATAMLHVSALWKSDKDKDFFKYTA